MKKKRNQSFPGTLKLLRGCRNDASSVNQVISFLRDRNGYLPFSPWRDDFSLRCVYNAPGTSSIFLPQALNFPRFPSRLAPLCIQLSLSRMCCPKKSQWRNIYRCIYESVMYIYVWQTLTKQLAPKMSWILLYRNFEYFVNRHFSSYFFLNLV